MFLDTTGIIKARRIYCCSRPANSYLKSEHKVRSRERLGGKPHEYFDLTGSAVRSSNVRPAKHSECTAMSFPLTV